MFLPFDEHGNALLSARPAAPAAPLAPELTALAADDARLSALEWSVVRLARRDRLGSLGEPGRTRRWLRGWLRLPNPRLADERLEALRRMAVYTWTHGFAVPGREVKAFLAAGFTPDQYEALAARVAPARLTGRRR